MGKGMEMTPLSETSLLGRRVLIADDEGPTRWSYVGLLRSAGARVTEARDGVEALELARSHPPDVILADVMMPRLDGLGLCAALRRDPALDGVTVVLLSDGAPPQAVWGSDRESQPLVDAVIAALALGEPPAAAEPAPARGEAPASGPSAAAGEPRVEQQSRLESEIPERENLRAQSMVSMHREPANRIVRVSHAVWRLGASGGAPAPARASGFGLELQAMSRLLGFGFAALLLGTIGLLVWHEVARAPAIEVPVTVIERAETALADPLSEPPTAAQVGEAGLTAFSGELLPGLDPSLAASEGQGALEIDGPDTVQITVDGVEHGSLPAALLLDEGRHHVRYRLQSETADRFYYVPAGSTRRLRVITRPGGFVDAR